MPTVNSCCCGCSLRTGTLILLWLGLIQGSLGTLSVLATAADGKVPASGLLIILLVAGSYLSIYVAGIYGVNQKRPSFLIPFLGFLGFVLIVIILIMFIMAVASAVLLDNLPGNSNKGNEAAAGAGAIISFEIACFIQLAINYYFFLVVFSYYKELKEEMPRQ